MQVVIVDDSEMDRYIARRVLMKSSEVASIEEAVSGDAFLEMYFSGGKGSHTGDPRLCVLMDINMPGRNGFETIEEMEVRIRDGRGPECVVVMMLTSSLASSDRKAADALQSVKGQLAKPLGSDGVQEILHTFREIHSKTKGV